MDKKKLKLISLIMFAVVFLINVSSFIRLTLNGVMFYQGPTTILLRLVTLAVPPVCIFFSYFRFNKKVLSIVSIIYSVYILTNIVGALRFGMPFSGVIILAAFITGFILALKAENETVFDVKDTVSEAAQTQVQTEKQTSIYDQQLKDGIITQEEYDQLVK